MLGKKLIRVNEDTHKKLKIASVMVSMTLGEFIDALLSKCQDDIKIKGNKDGTKD